MKWTVWCRGMAVLLMLSVIMGCTTRLQTMTEAERIDMVPAFQEGRTVLDCRAACSWQWISRRVMLNSLYVTQQWDALAAQVLEIGYQENLAYFWLGRSAEARGYLPAAARYYAIANRLTSVPDGLVRCNRWLEGCFGINVARESYVSFNAIQTALAGGSRPPDQLTQRRPRPMFPAPVRLEPHLMETRAPDLVAETFKVASPTLPDDEVLVPPIRR